MRRTAVGETTARASAFAGTAYDIVVRPRAALLRTTALSIVLSAVPLAVALIWVSFPLRLWAAVATIVLVLAVAAVYVFVRLRTAFVGVSASRLEVRSVVSPNRSASKSDVHRLVLATTFTGSIDRVTRELLALGASDEPVFRMRGDLWDDSAIAKIAAAFDVKVTEFAKPMTIRDFYQHFPRSRAWYERRNGIILALVAAIALVAVALGVELVGLLAH
jgi:hypothetical protein